jgi:hypothetical protein
LFARYLATIGYEPGHFSGALLWFTEHGVWNYADEGIGYRIVEQMNSAGGQPCSFENSPWHHFRGDELNEAVAMFLQSMIFGWDAYYLPQWSWGTGEFFVHVSHESHLLIVTKTKAFHDEVFAELDRMNFNPAPVSEQRMGRFCRQSVS